MNRSAPAPGPAALAARSQTVRCRIPAPVRLRGWVLHAPWREEGSAEGRGVQRRPGSARTKRPPPRPPAPDAVSNESLSLPFADIHTVPMSVRGAHLSGQQLLRKGPERAAQLHGLADKALYLCPTRTCVCVGACYTTLKRFFVLEEPFLSLAASAWSTTERGTCARSPRGT